MKPLITLVLLLIPCFSAANMMDTWKADIQHQPLNARPIIEARYTNASRKAVEIDAENYNIVFDLKSDTGQKITALAVKSDGTSTKTINNIHIELTDASGTVYSSLNTKELSRINIYRRGPYYIETHWLDIQLTDGKGNIAPAKGEMVFYSYPEKTHIGFIFHVTKDIEVQSAAIVLDSDATTFASPTEQYKSGNMRINDFALLNRGERKPTFAVIYPVPKGIDDVTAEKTNLGLRLSNYIYNSEAHNTKAIKWESGHKPAAYFELFPLNNGEINNGLEAEIRPLLQSSIAMKSGRAYGYDAKRGCYKVQTDNTGNFNHHYYDNRNDYEVADFSIQNDDLPRKIYILHETGKFPGLVECGVALDARGVTLPITVQISKNFSGEDEEPFYNPGDTPFSETIFPLYLSTAENRALKSLHLYQNWGSHPLKQFSSLGAWMDYYHMSTGVTETTCYVPFLFAGLDGVSIADFRPMSQKLWESQPQHDNIAGHSFLRYQDGKGVWHFLEYTGTTFRSTGPNWADMSMGYLSDDGKVKVTVDVFELPQTDELRNFIHMRVDFLDNITIKDGDLARNLRLLNIASWVQQMRYKKVSYGGPSGEPVTNDIKLDDSFTIAGAPLASENSFATIYPDPKGANAFIVRSFEGKINGQAVAPGVSVIGQKNGDTILMMVPVTKAKEIKSGDSLDIDLFIMPYGDGTQDYKPAQKAAYDFGLNAPWVVNITQGKKISDFPTRIELNSNGKAEFTISGGMNCIPVIVEGIKDYTCLRLYNVDGEKTLVDHAQKGERDGYQVFAKDNGTFGFVFLINTDGKDHKYIVE